MESLTTENNINNNTNNTNDNSYNNNDNDSDNENDDIDEQYYLELTEYYNNELQKEKNVKLTLEQKYSNNKKQLADIEEEYNNIKTKELISYVNIPKLDNNEYKKALIAQELGKERCEARGEEYIIPSYLLNTLSIPKLQEEAKRKNAEITKLNESITASNVEIHNKKYNINQKYDELSKYCNKLEKFIKESNDIIINFEKKIIYL